MAEKQKPGRCAPCGQQMISVDLRNCLGNRRETQYLSVCLVLENQTEEGG